ncbi:MAG TPA: hypothetical protein VMW56_23235 [Candidatus Margulisiibacteriota bacterium]|nr:hypothetical protein [Candidatus Margulisiibacteriota bacterium]
MIAPRQHLFRFNGQHIWLSVVEQDLFVKMAPSGMAARDDGGRLTIECADGSSRPCGFDPDAVRERIGSLENQGLLIRIAHTGWALTDAGRKIWAELIRLGGGGARASTRMHPPRLEPASMRA